MLVFILLVASFDLLLGYTGIVSFAHTMFFGIGAYGVAIASTRMGGLGFAVLGGRAALAVSLVLSLLIGLFAAAREGDLLRHDHAGGGLGLPDAGLAAVGLHRRRGRPDFKNPRCCSPARSSLRDAAAGRGGRRQASPPTTCSSSPCSLLFLAMLRIVNSPFGRVLQAIRENDFRAEAIGFRTVVYRTWPTVLSAMFATLAGALLALWLRYQGPDTTLSFEIMLDILLVVVIGGMGTIYGAVIGSVLFVIAQNYLQDLLKLARRRAEGVPLLAAALSPDRWLLWLGVLFVLSVYHFPTGVVGRARRALTRKRDECALEVPGLRGREIHVTEWGDPQAGWWWPGTAWRAPDATWTTSRTWRAALPRDLSRHPRAGVVSQWSPDPGTSTAWILRAPGALSLDQLGVAAACGWSTSMGGAIGRGGGRAAARARPQAWCSTTSAPSWRARGERIPHLCRQPVGVCHHEGTGQVLPHLQAHGWLRRRSGGCSPRTSMRRLPDGRVTPHYDRRWCSQFSTTRATTTSGRLGCADHPRAVPARRAPTCCCPRWPTR